VKGGVDIYQRYKQFQHFSKKGYIARNIMHVLHYEYYHYRIKIFSAHPILSFQLSSEYVLKQKYKPKYAQICVNFIVKSQKSPSDGGSAPRLPMSPAAGGFAPRPLHWPYTISDFMSALYISGDFA